MKKWLDQGKKYTLNRLRTKERLAQIGVVTDASCAICGIEQESCHHLLFRCCFSRKVCVGLLRWLDIRVALNECIFTSWKKWGRKYRSKRKQNVCYAVLAATVYHVWLVRNNAVWNLKVPMPNVVIKCIKSKVCIRARSCVNAKWSDEERDWLDRLSSSI